MTAEECAALGSVLVTTKYGQAFRGTLSLVDIGGVQMVRVDNKWAKVIKTALFSPADISGIRQILEYDVEKHADFDMGTILNPEGAVS